MKIPRGNWIGSTLGALIALALLYLAGWRPGPHAPAYDQVVVDSAAIVEGEPDADVGILERITRPAVEPTVVATAPGAAAGDLRAFCSAAGWDPPGAPSPAPNPETPTMATSSPVASLPRDSAALPTPPSGHLSALRPRPPPVALIRSGTVGRSLTELWAVTSDGDLRRSSFDVRPPLTFRADGDSIVLQGSRWWWVRPITGILSCAGGGWLARETGSVVPLAAGCGLGAYITLR